MADQPRISSTPLPMPRFAHWPIWLSGVLIGVSYALLPETLRIGPRWSLLAVIGVMFLAISVVRWREMHYTTHYLALAVTAIATLAVISSAFFLIFRLTTGTEPATQLLRYGALVWVANVLTFALWYWNVDGGGPFKRHMNQPYRSTDFLFPQKTLAPDETTPEWMPDFVDYLFLSFNTSAAFSPTDTLILSRFPKMLMMIQASISIIVLAVLIARAINTLPS